MDQNICINKIDDSDEWCLFISTKGKFQYRHNKNNIQIRMYRPDWYLSRLISDSKIIAEKLKDLSVKRLILMGSSKGATGAVLFGYTLSKLLPNISFKVLAFTPYFLLRKDLYQEDEFESLPPSLIRLNKNKNFAKVFERFGNLIDLINAKKQNIEYIAIFPENGLHGEDIQYKSILNNDNIRQVIIPMDCHSVIDIFLLWDRKEDFSKMNIEFYEGEYGPPTENLKYVTFLDDLSEFKVSMEELLYGDDEYLDKLEWANNIYRQIS